MEENNKIRTVMVDNEKGKIEPVHLKKSFDGWRVVHPIKNDDSSWNWANLIAGGSWIKLFAVAIIVIIVIGLAYEYSSNLEFCKELLEQRVKIP